MTNKNMNHYFNVWVNNGIHIKQIREFGKELGLTKRKLRNILEDSDSKIKYKIRLQKLEPNMDVFPPKTDYTWATIMDVYSTNEEKAQFLYSNLDKLYNKINGKTKEKGLGTIVKKYSLGVEN